MSRYEWLVEWKRPGVKKTRKFYQTRAGATKCFDRVRCNDWGDCMAVILGPGHINQIDEVSCLQCNPPPDPEWVKLSRRTVGDWEQEAYEKEGDPFPSPYRKVPK